MLARHAVLLTPSLSLPLSQLPRYNQKEHCNFHSSYTLPSSVSSKSFACHSLVPSAAEGYKNCRGVYQQFPFRNSPLATLLHESHVSHAPAGRKNPLPAAHYCLKSFSCNTYESPRKCCKQKTYAKAKPFRCNTYTKQGVPSFKPNALSLFVSPFIRPLPPYFITSRNGCALPAAMGAAAKRARRLQERSS